MLSSVVHLITRHSIYIIILAVICTGLAGWYAGGVFNALSTKSDFTSDTAESLKVEATASRIGTTQTSGVLLFSPKEKDMTVDDPQYKAAISSILTPLTFRYGTRILSYFNTKESAFVSSDRTKTYASISVTGTTDQQYDYLNQYVSNTHSSVVNISLGGALVAQKQSSHQVETDLHMAELLSLPLLALLLFLIFRGVVAALLPLILGIVSILGAIAVIHILTHFTDIDKYSLNIVTIMGLGLSVDYSLLIVSRFREEIEKQKDNVDKAITKTLHSAGRTIFFSGLTVMVSLGVLTIFPIGFLRSIGLGGIATLLVALIASLILLPALLHVMGPWINTLSLTKRHHTAVNAGWARFAHFITSYPWIGLVVGIVVIGILSLPLPHAHFAGSDYRILPVGSSSREVASSLATDFNNKGTPLTVLVTGAQPLTTLPTLKGVLHISSLNVSGVTPHQAIVSVYPDTNSDPTGIVTTIRMLRVKGYDFQVGGPSAELVDSIHILEQYLPIAIALIILAMFILLSILLHSIILPIQAMVINCLALTGSFGILAFIFQDGHFTSSQWLANTGGLNPNILLLIFAIAFGLSMDYSAFLYSRIREEYDVSHNNKAAIVHGLERTSGIITAAATLLFVVMAAFASSKIAFLQQVGIGLAMAVLLDAFLVRILLVPAVMYFLGHANWYSPRWLFKHMAP